MMYVLIDFISSTVVVSRRGQDTGYGTDVFNIIMIIYIAIEIKRNEKLNRHLIEGNRNGS